MATASADCPPASLPAEHPLFILYTSGTTGKPKGIVHTTGGYLLGAHLTTKYVFDLHDDDIFWCTADIGWVTGHSYVVYGPLSNGATSVMYEGAPDSPGQGSLLVDHRAAEGVDLLHGADRDPRVHALGRRVPEDARPVVAAAAGQRRRADQSRGVDVVPRGHRRRALPDRRHLVADRDGRDHDDAAAGHHADQAGELRAAVLRRRARRWSSATARRARPTRAASWSSRSRGRRCCAGSTAIPSATRSSTGRRSRASTSPATARARIEDGYFWVMGRVDDVLNVAGHRLGTAEIESALVSHPGVAEAAVVGPPHELKGQAIFAFVTPKAGVEPIARAEEGAVGPRGQGDRRAGAPGRDPLHRRAAEDALGQDHAPPAARDRDQRRRRAAT